MPLITPRIAWAYAAILVGVTLFVLRRFLLPTSFELQGVPFDIAAASALNACYSRPALSSCADLAIVLPAAIVVVAATGWGSLGRTIFALILAVLPVGLYLALGPVWIPLILLLIIPLAVEWASWALFGPAEA